MRVWYKNGANDILCSISWVFRHFTILDGMGAYYNYTKKHGAIKGMTPAKAPLIQVDGRNKWKTIIQNASLHKEVSA